MTLCPVGRTWEAYGIIHSSPSKYSGSLYRCYRRILLCPTKALCTNTVKHVEQLNNPEAPLKNLKGIPEDIMKLTQSIPVEDPPKHNNTTSTKYSLIVSRSQLENL